LLGDDVVGLSILDVLPDGGESGIRNCLESAVQTRNAASTEGLLLSRRGCWYELRVTPSRSGFTALFRDISDRKQQEAQQRDTSERWRATLNVMPQMVWSMAAGASQPDFYNDRWYEFTGLPHGTCIGLDWRMLMHPDDQEAVRQIWRQCRATGEPYEAQYRIRHRDGDYRWIVSRGRLQTNEAGEHVRWYGTCTDIHRRVLQSQELERSETRVQRILSSVPQILWSAGPDGALDFVSNQWAATFGAADPVLGTGWLDVVHPDDRELALARWTASLASGEPYEVEFRIVRPSESAPGRSSARCPSATRKAGSRGGTAPAPTSISA
jgi:PAS domain S-box-containing protein